MLGVYVNPYFPELVMKVHIEIDLTPEEARTLAGLPNYDQMHKAFVNMAKGKMESTGQNLDIEPMVKAWSEFGGVAQDAFNSLLRAAVSGSKSYDFSTSPSEKKPSVDE
jgi:Family of unknown function (DUF6489)